MNDLASMGGHGKAISEGAPTQTSGIPIPKSATSAIPLSYAGQQPADSGRHLRTGSPSGGRREVKTVTYNLQKPRSQASHFDEEEEEEITMDPIQLPFTNETAPSSEHPQFEGTITGLLLFELCTTK